MLGFKIDVWTIWGFIAQGMFFLRFVIQWYASEKKKSIVVPHVFWYLSLAGAFMIFVYAIARKDIVFLISGILQAILFSRNLIISKNEKKK